METGLEGSTVIEARLTMRKGGVSQNPWQSLNLGLNTADDKKAVGQNRERLQQSLPADVVIQWMRQEHGNQVFVADAATAQKPIPSADAIYTQTPGVACAVLTADCLPILLYSADGRECAAVHAGWRGLVNGVIAKAAAHFKSDRAGIVAWIGPCIRMSSYEVGDDLIQQMQASCGLAAKEFSSPSSNEGKSLLDLAAVARAQLQQAGIAEIIDTGLCTYSDPEHFYSFRRDGETGRFACLIWLK